VKKYYSNCSLISDKGAEWRILSSRSYKITLEGNPKLLEG